MGLERISEMREAKRLRRPAYPKTLKPRHHIPPTLRLSQCSCCKDTAVRIVNLVRAEHAEPEEILTCMRHATMSRDNINRFLTLLEEMKNVRNNPAPDQSTKAN